MIAFMQDNGKSAVAFPATNGIKQGCDPAPILFSTMFSAMLFDAFSCPDNGIDIRYHTDGSLFRTLQAMTKLSPLFPAADNDWYC